jgi:hypothetical protein
MKFIQLLFHQPVWLTILGLLTLSPPALADPSTSDDYVLSEVVFSDSGGEANSSEYSLTATVGTPFAEMDATGETEPVGDRTALGTLRDDQGHPIAGVTLEIDGKTATTNALGNWEINGLVDETTYTVTARKDGYTFAPTTVDIGNETITTVVTIAPLTTLKLTAKPDT